MWNLPLLLFLPILAQQEKEPAPDPAKFELQRTIADHSDTIFKVRYSRSGKYLVTGARDGIRVWEVAKRAPVRVIPGASYFDLHPSEDQLAYADPAKGSVIRIYDFHNGHELKRIETNAGSVGTYSYLPDGHGIAVLSGGVTIWDPSTGKKGPEFFKDVGMVDRLIIGKRYGAFTSATAVRLFDLSTGKLSKEIGSKAVDRVALDTAAKYIATSSGSIVTVWEFSKGKEAYSIRVGTGNVTALAFNPDGKGLVAAGSDKKLTFYVLEKEAKEVKSFEPHAAAVQDLAFSADGKTLATVGADRKLLIWNGSTGDPVADMGIPYGYVSAGLSPNGKTLYAGDARGGLSIWNLETGSLEKTIKAHETGVATLAPSPDGKRLVTTGQDKTLRVWDTAEWKEIRRIDKIADGVTLPVVTDREVFYPAEGALRRWGLDEGEGKAVLENKGRGINALSLSADAKRAFLADSTTMTVGEVESGKIVKSGPFANRTAPNQAAISPDGSIIAFLMAEDALFLAKADDFSDVGTLSWSAVKDQRAPLTANVAFSPDGRYIASASGVTLVIWSVEKKQVARTYAVEGGPTQRIRFLGWAADMKSLWAITDPGAILLFGKKK